MGMKAEPTADIEANIETLLAQAGWLRRFARALLHNVDDAEDLAHDTFTTALRQPAAGAKRAWLATVARNLAVDRFRGATRRSRREKAAQECDAGRVATPEELVGNAQIHRHVAEAVANLAEPFRQTLVLRFYQGLSSVEIARNLREPEGTIRWRVKEGLGRVRRELDRRHGNQRAAWVAALTPLLPKADAPSPRRLHATRSFPSPLDLAATAMGLLSVVAGAIVLFTPKSDRAGDAPKPPSLANAPVPRTTPAVRLNLAGTLAPQASASAALPPGPGRIDAQSLAEELLSAIQGNDYDAFVAKGSAAFRAAVATARFAQLSAKLGGRLSQGHRVTTLGSVRRPEHIDWLFKIEFSDDGDNALATLPMDGWQVAGFLINEPFPMPVEMSP
jgi:RNA polymerase sigma-70 factor (ECF subfamily)